MLENDVADPLARAAGSELFDDEEEFDPLAVDDLEFNQDEVDDDNPLDTVDYPLVRNMPQDMRRESVYSPEYQGSAQRALAAMLDHNPGRRVALLTILDLCREGCPSSTITKRLDELNKDNRSVYSAMTYCRMLERAGGLRLEMPETSEEREDVEEGVEYLVIKERVDPLWYTTEAGLEVYGEEMSGAAFRDIVLDRDSVYIDVYVALMKELEQYPMTRVEIDELTDTFPVTKSPRRYGSHFIDMLERVYAIEWHDHAWHLNDFGRSMIPAAEQLSEKRRAQAAGSAAGEAQGGE